MIEKTASEARQGNKGTHVFTILRVAAPLTAAALLFLAFVWILGPGVRDPNTIDAPAGSSAVVEPPGVDERTPAPLD